MRLGSNVQGVPQQSAEDAHVWPGTHAGSPHARFAPHTRGKQQSAVAVQGAPPPHSAAVRQTPALLQRRSTQQSALLAQALPSFLHELPPLPPPLTSGCTEISGPGTALLSSAGEYFRHYGLTPQKLALAKPDAIVMHPGPMNRGVEIHSAVADGSQAVILPQVTFGIAVRMAVMSIVAGN